METATAPAPVLVVEDEPDIRETLRDVLRAEGYRVMTASNGKEALDCLRQASKPKPGLILLDLSMPIMNGYDVLRALKASDDLADIPVTVVSALANKRACGETPFLVKPVALDSLLSVVAEACGAPKTHGSA